MDLVHQVHDKMKTLIKPDGATLDGIYFCPHYPNGKVFPYSMGCDCRKPGTGLIRKAEADFDIDMENSYVIGDRCSDIEMAHNACLKSILVKTGYGKGDLAYVFPRFPFQPLSCGGRPSGCGEVDSRVTAALSKNAPLEILMVKLSAIGDVVHTLAFLDVLHRNFPQARIDWLVEEGAAGIIEGHPAIRRVIISRRKSWLRELADDRRFKNVFGEIRSFLKDLRSIGTIV
jgi:hypothetical protein